MSRPSSHLVRNGSKCPRCGSTDITVLETRGGLRYFECQRAICRERFHVDVLHLVPASRAAGKAAPASLPATPAEDKPKRPRCPYCHNVSDVREIRHGQFSCRRRHHPRVVMGPDGGILRIDYPPERGDGGRICRRYGDE